MKKQQRFTRSAIALATFYLIFVFGINIQSSHAGETTNKIGITMVDIPAGSFIMGSCKTRVDSYTDSTNKTRAFLGQAPIQAEKVTCLAGSPDLEAENSETPQHQVSIQAFQMGKTEVTLGQFKKFIVHTGRNDLVTDEFIKYNNKGDNAAVVGVSWLDAQDFIKWLNQVGGTGGYRLPSEAEWEYACRAGGRHRYCGSNDPSSFGWFDKNSGERVNTVGQKQANAFGLYDMSGNGWEWVQDTQHKNYQGAPADGSAWEDQHFNRVERGGYWYTDPRNSRASNRTFSSPRERRSLSSFRVARSIY